jgi:hypothetical protein
MNRKRIGTLLQMKIDYSETTRSPAAILFSSSLLSGSFLTKGEGQ